MAKDVRFASKIARHKRDKMAKLGDLILPDEILVSILSLLTIKEAARTSVLSHRWENLWAVSTGSLNFEATETYWKIMQHLDLKLLFVERSRYVRWVNHVINSHKGATIDEFRVCFDLDTRSKCDIDKWVEFALSKKAKKLDLDFNPFLCSLRKPSKKYTLPLELIYGIHTPSGLPYITPLTSLCLNNVEVTAELIEYFLSNCPLLQRLHVAESTRLVDLKVTGSSLQLKHLELSLCPCFKKLEISAPNLVSLTHVGGRISLHIKNAPLLVDVHISAAYEANINYAFDLLSSYLSHLETLTLGISKAQWRTGDLDFPQLPELVKLRHLRWKVEHEGQSLLGLTSMIMAAPFLHKFTFQVWNVPSTKFGLKRNVAPVNKGLHKYLKIIEIVGFNGSQCEVELASYMLEVGIMLEKIIIDPRDPVTIGTSLEFENTEEHKRMRDFAIQKFLPKLPSGGKLLLL